MNSYFITVQLLYTLVLFGNVQKKMTKKQQSILKVVLVALECGSTEGVACRTAGIEQHTLSRWKKDKEIAHVVANAENYFYENLATISQRKLQKELESKKTPPVLTIFALANLKKSRWQSINKVEHTGAGGGPITLTLGVPRPAIESNPQKQIEDRR